MAPIAVAIKYPAELDVEETDARAVLGVTANLSEMEIEAAYRRRASEVRKRFDDARDNATRTKCRRERAAIEEARHTLLRVLEEEQLQQGKWSAWLLNSVTAKNGNAGR